ncbi:MAG TPA: HEAT repeat domain-containing protein [Dongiaceae bacterium]|nr:HEAT repeat domain-containing protein [Dongiaceae bacterium]
MLTFKAMLHMAKTREVLLVVISSMMFIIFFLFALLICHKVFVEYGARRYKRLKERYLEVMGQRMAGSDIRVAKPLKHQEYEVWGDVIAEMMANCEEETRERLKDEARNLGLDRYFKELTRSQSWTTRFLAVEKLGLMKLPEMKELYRSILQHEKDPHVINKTVWALSMIADEEVPDIINSVLRKPSFLSSKYAEFIYTNVIASFRDRGAEESLLGIFARIRSDEEIPLILKRDIIAACGVSQFYPSIEIVKEYFLHFPDSTDMRIACLRALERLSAGDACHIVAKGLRDTDWRMRAVAAKSGRVCGDGALATLTEALRDKNYYVRMNAALSLSRIGPRGIEALTGATLADDRFAGDIARFVLKR